MRKRAQAGHIDDDDDGNWELEYQRREKRITHGIQRRECPLGYMWARERRDARGCCWLLDWDSNWNVSRIQNRRHASLCAVWFCVERQVIAKALYR